jgi:WD40 repeat protein
MRDIAARPLCFLVALVFAGFQILELSAQDAKDVTALKAQAQTALEKKTQAENALKELEKQQAELKGKLIQAKSAPAQAQRKQTEAEAALKAQQEALKKAQAAKDAAAAAAKTADDVVKKADEAKKKAIADKKPEAEQKTLDEALKKATDEKAKADKMLADQQAAFDKADATVKATEKTIADAKDTIAKAPEMAKALETEVAAISTKVIEAQKSLEAVTGDWLGKQKAVEAQLIATGQMVSFSESIAPIFAQRCTACHNARTAKGRLNMESFAGLSKGGESGPALEPGDPDSSNLFLQVDSGAMPQDADPLSKEEIEIIKKWIATGANLDAGKDPEAALIAIMPKRPQPAAPESYRVPIPITALAYSPDGKLLASSGYHEILLWNPDNGQLVRRIANVAERVYDLRFSADGKTLAAAAGTPAQIGELKLFNVEDGKLLGDFGISDDAFFALAWSADGKRLASAGADRTIRVFDIATGKEELSIEDHADWVMGLTFSPDGTRLASASRDKTAKVFDAKTGDSLVTFNGHGDSVYGVEFTPDGNQIVSAGADKQVRIWNASDAKEVRKIGGFGGDIFRLQVTKDGTVFTASADKNARQHKLADGAALKTFPGHADWVYTVAHSPATNQAATGTYTGQIHIFNTQDGKQLSSFTAAPGLAKPETTAAAK